LTGQSRYRLLSRRALPGQVIRLDGAESSSPSNPKTPPGTRISWLRSPEASGPFLHIVDGFLFGVSQSRKHSRCRFPGNFALFVEVPHGVTHFFELPKNVGDQLDSGAAWVVIFSPVIFNIDPESKTLRHAEFHSCSLTRNSQSVASLKLAYLERQNFAFFGRMVRCATASFATAVLVCHRPGHNIWAFQEHRQ
jgi:hypothetical protein